MEIILRYFDDCPNWQETERLLMALQTDYGFRLSRQQVRSPDEADALGFRGSPTVLIDGIDPFADPDAPIGLACRVYRTPAGLRGSPDAKMLRMALDRIGDPSSSNRDQER